MTKTIEELLVEISEPYTREIFEADYERVVQAICDKRGIARADVHAHVAAHNYEHAEDAPEDEYIEVMCFAPHFGFNPAPKDGGGCESQPVQPCRDRPRHQTLGDGRRTGA